MDYIIKIANRRAVAYAIITDAYEAMNCNRPNEQGPLRSYIPLLATV